MHKRLLNEAFFELVLQPDGPILIKAQETGADPTLPDMEFVRTNGKPYLPGSSLKGVIRSHCERLARTVGNRRFACDPLDNRNSCSAFLQQGRQTLSTAEVHAKSCFVCRLFGNTALASRFYINDAMPSDATEPITEERNGVAIDRVFGSAAAGALFNYETVVAGQFNTTLLVRNFGLAQLGLLALTLRDIQQQRVRIGFGKSRGLGTVTLTVKSLVLRYPTCEIQSDTLQILGGEPVSTHREVPGIGAFPENQHYDMAPNDKVALEGGITYTSNDWGEPEIRLQEESHITAFWRASVQRWREEVQRWNQTTRQGL